MIKKFTCLLLLFVSSLAGMNLKILADEPGNNKTTLTQLRSSNDKKRIPSRTFIECEAINGMLVFDANFEYEFISVSVIGEDATTSIEGTITPIQPYIIIPAFMIGEYSIQCTTEGGAVYEGTITL